MDKSADVNLATASADALLERLRSQSSRVVDTFRKWDDDMSGSIDRQEFRQGLLFLGKGSTSDSTPKLLQQIDALFDAIDKDKSGTLELKELDKMLRAGYTEILAKSLQDGAQGEIELDKQNKGYALRKGRKVGDFEYANVAGGGATAHVRTFRGSDVVLKEGTQTIANSHKLDLSSIDASSGEPADLLRHALTKNAVRVIDLFRDWDFNGDGQLSRKEFLKGVAMMGLPGGEAAGQLFDTWDALPSSPSRALTCPIPPIPRWQVSSLIPGMRMAGA